MEQLGFDKLASALAKAQSQIETAKKDKKNDHFGSRYADLASVWEACREALTSNGLSVVQVPVDAPTGHVGLLTVLLHESGQNIQGKFFMPVKDPTNPQAVGSALTYARRYALSAFVSVSPDDDDGNSAAAPTKQAAEPKINEAVLVKQYVDKFATLKTAQDMKGLYAMVRNDKNLSDKVRSELTSQFAGYIKAHTGADVKEGK